MMMNPYFKKMVVVKQPIKNGGGTARLLLCTYQNPKGAKWFLKSVNIPSLRI